MNTNIPKWAVTLAVVLLAIILILSMWILSSAAPLQTMSDAKAVQEARLRFGVMGGIGMQRPQGATYWTKAVGVYSQECAEPFTVLGSGLNTWEAAFANVPGSAINGPLAGDINLKTVVWDDTGVVAFQWIIDGRALGDEIKYPDAPTKVSVVATFRTATAPSGIHVLCGFARDAAGNVGRLKAFVFNIDQTLPSVGTTIDFATEDDSNSPTFEKINAEKTLTIEGR